MSARDLTDSEAEDLIKAALRLASWVNGGGLERLTTAAESLDGKVSTNGEGSLVVWVRP